MAPSFSEAIASEPSSQKSWLCTKGSRIACNLDNWLDHSIFFGNRKSQRLSDILKNGFARFEDSIIAKLKNGTAILQHVGPNKSSKLAQVCDRH